MSNTVESKGVTSDDIRDELSHRMLDVVKNGGAVLRNQDGEVIFDDRGMPVREPIPASYVTAIVGYLKAFPPATIPQAGARSPTGLLKEHADVLPFGARKTA